MLTRKGLTALANALADEFHAVGMTSLGTANASLRVVNSLREVGAVTRQFDSLRFTGAVHQRLASKTPKQ